MRNANLRELNLLVIHQQLLYRFGLFTYFFNAIRQLLLAQLAVCDQVIVLGGFFALSVA